MGFDFFLFFFGRLRSGFFWSILNDFVWFMMFLFLGFDCF